MAGGRPKKKLNLPKDWEERVLNIYSEGGSDVEVKALLYQILGSFSNNLWDRLMGEEGRFWETIKIGRILSQDWWERKGRQSLENKDFNSVLWYMNMKNRFGWKDRHDHTSKGEKMKYVIQVGNANIESEE